MRVISGKYKGRRILPPIKEGVRPTYDKVKEAMFALLARDIEGATVIDLFAGTGGLGIEALSRGAQKVYFCDNSGASLEVVKKNTEYCPDEEKEILRGDFSDCLRKLSARKVKADIILCDPPYGKGIPEQALALISEYGLLAENGVIIVERSASDLPVKKYFTYVTEKTYGEICLDVCRNITKCAVTGSFDPFTLGHKYVVKKALENFDFVYVVMLNNESKQARYSVEKRLRMAELSLTDYKKRIKVEYYEGMTVDYCKDNGIKTIYRGYRNSEDFEYEKIMASYNKERGDVDTVLVQAESSISSTDAKRIFDEGGDIENYVCDDVYRLMRR